MHATVDLLAESDLRRERSKIGTNHTANSIKL